MTDDPRWKTFPVFREFFLQWRKARGTTEPGSRRNVFSVDFEELLRDSGLTSALDRADVFHDLKIMRKAGMLGVKCKPNRSEEIVRLTLPHDAEPRLRELFADELPVKNPAFDLNAVDWIAEMSFIPSANIGVAPEDLIKLNDFIRCNRNRPAVSIKERSLQIFGDEKRLDALRNTALFRDDRLSLATLRCYPVAEPLGWEPGPNQNGPLLVIENACTWDSYCKWNCQESTFSGIVYGGGNRFMDSVVRLHDIFDKIGGLRPVLYFGDIDPQGLRIPRVASAVAMQLGLPPIEPDLWSYEWLLKIGRPGQLSADNDTTEEDLAWINPLRTQILNTFERTERVAQEGLNWEWLQSQSRH